ncbi:hypothetical protein PINS_up020216 [Pythium insidiosum]|nr:hypothetical protein PINS_up020216 [Pythium insidiosum]
MGAVLAEMRALGVSFGPQIEELVARNQPHLQGTPFALETRDDGDLDARVTALRERLERLQDAPREAAQAADALVRPLLRVDGDDGNGAVRLSPHRQWLLRLGATSVAPETESALPLVVHAYVAAKQTHKLLALARGLELTTDAQETPARADALALLLQDAMARGDEELARTALRVVAKQRQATLQTLKLAPSLVRSLVAFVAPRDDVRDAVATLHRLCMAALDEEDGKAEDEEQVLTLVLGALVRQDASVAQLIALLADVDRRRSAAAASDAADAPVVVSPRVYAELLTAMKQRRQRVLRDQRKSSNATTTTTPPTLKRKPYDAEDVATLWRDCRRRVGRVDAALLNASSAWLAQSDDERHWRLLVDAYDAAVVVVADSSAAQPLHAEVFEHVLAVCQRQGADALDATRVLAIVDAAREHLSRQQQGVPAALVARATELLAAQQALTPDAIERVLLPLRKPSVASLLLALHALTTKTTTTTSDDVALATLLLQRLGSVQPRGIESFATADALIEWLHVAVVADAEKRAPSTRDDADAVAALACDVVVAYEKRKVATDSDDVMADAKRWTKLVKHADGAREHAAWYQRVLRLVGGVETATQQRLSQRVQGLEALARTLEQEAPEKAARARPRAVGGGAVGVIDTTA